MLVKNSLIKTTVSNQSSNVPNSLLLQYSRCNFPEQLKTIHEIHEHIRHDWQKYLLSPKM